MSSFDHNEIVDETEEPSYDISSSWATVIGDTIERSFVRRRSLECSSLEINIIGTELAQDHTLYIIQISSTVKQWVVARRFKDFRYLDKELRKKFPQLNIPVLPPKIYLFSSTDPAVVDERKNQLEVYLKTLSFIPLIWSRNDLVLFLNDESNSMMFMWNFEKMRKMQDTLSSMSIENQNETSRLATDLTFAKTQVHALQERLAHMEMLMLQQATGLASEELSSDAIRCLSGVGGSDTTQRLQKEFTIGFDSNYQPYNDMVDGFAAITHDNKQQQHSSPVNALNPLQRSIVEKAFEDHVASGNPMSTSEVVDVLSFTTSDENTRRKSLQNLESKTPEQVRTVAVSLQLEEALRLSNDILTDKFDIHNITPRESCTSPPLPPKAVSTDTGARTISTSNSAINLQHMRDPIALSLAEEALFSYSFESNGTSSKQSIVWMDHLFQEIDEIIHVLVPSPDTIEERIRVFRYVRDLVSSTLGVQLFPTSALVTQTFLPDSDLDTSAFVIKKDDDSWFVLVNEALCMSSHHSTGNGGGGETRMKYGSFDSQISQSNSLSDDDFRITNVSFVNGPVKKIKILINNLSVDISMNQAGSLYSQYLIETLDDFVGKNHLFKRSLLLVEMWCMYESPRFTNGAGSMLRSNSSSNINEVSTCSDTNRLNTWAITVMLIWVFNKEGSQISHPLQALGQFLRIYSTFDWNRYTLTMKGPVNASDLSIDTTDDLSIDKFFPDSLLDTFYEPKEDANNNASENALSTATTTTIPSTDIARSGKNSITIGEIVIDLEDTESADPTVTTLASLDTNATTTSFEESAKQQQVSMNGTTSTTVPNTISVPPPSVFAKGMVYERYNIESTTAVAMRGNNSHEAYEQSIVNILDPVRGNMNLSQHIGIEGFHIITSVMSEGYKNFRNMCESFMKLSIPSPGSKAAVTDDSTMMKNIQLLFINTLLKVVSWEPNFKKNNTVPIPASNTVPINHPGGGGRMRDDSRPPLPKILGALLCDVEDLLFSLRYAELVLGGKINCKILERLIIVILVTKGPMPVGEVGKNMQMITGCENFSKKLKEQYSGLKKAIETLGSRNIRMGNEHPFNPVVSLVNKEDLMKNDYHSNTNRVFAHSDYVLVPFQAFVALNYDKEPNTIAATTTNNSSNSTNTSPKKNYSMNNYPRKMNTFYPRSNIQVPNYGGTNGVFFADYEDNMSLISQDYASTSSNFGNSPGKHKTGRSIVNNSNNINTINKSYKHNSKSNNYQTQSSNTMSSIHYPNVNNNNAIYHNQHTIPPMLSISPQATNILQYQQQMQMHYMHQQQLYHQMMLQQQSQQGHLSMSSSLSSSYSGQVSPLLGQSPVGPGNGFFYPQNNSVNVPNPNHYPQPQSPKK